MALRESVIDADYSAVGRAQEGSDGRVLLVVWLAWK
jgi:hypothetical protein